MSERWKDKVGAAILRFRKQAGDVLAEREVALVMGHVAGVSVLDNDGNVIVEAGHVIDEGAVERARAVGKLGALAASVVTAGMQDLRERSAAIADATADGREARTMSDLDLYVRARSLRDHTVMVDVTDVRGTVVIAAGTRVSEAVISAAGDHGLLGALVYAASLPQPAAPPPPSASMCETGAVAPKDAPPSPPVARRRLPIIPVPPGSEDPSDPSNH